MRILLADDEARVCHALRALLRQQPGLEVGGEVSDASTLLAQIQTACPDLVLLDWELPGMKPVSRLAALRCLCPQARVVVMSGLPEAEREALRAGADFFVSKGRPPEQLLAVIDRIRQQIEGAAA